MFKQLRAACIAFVVLSVVTGLIYPVVMTVLAQVVFPKQANGSLIMVNGTPVGSELIGQYFSDPKYFWGRPSATGPVPYTAFNADKSTGSTGSNLGPLNPALIGDGTNNTAEGTVKTMIDAYHAADPDNTAPIPVDLVTASASGLDPDISPAGAAYQVHRVAKARGLDDATVKALVDKHTTGRSLGILGEPHVNVLDLNLDLDAVPNQNPPTPTATATDIATVSAPVLAATAAPTSGR
jgi:K+-transporting ATPase ATPase C chain